MAAVSYTHLDVYKRQGYTIKIFNTINFQKSMHYNPFAYIHSEKDILKLVTTLIANTKGDGCLLYTSFTSRMGIKIGTHF